MTRKANEIAPRWRKPLTRKRGRPCDGVRDVEVAGLVEALEPGGFGGADTLERAEQLGLAERLPALERADGAVEAHHRRLVDLEVNVGGARLDGVRKEGVQIHRPTCIGRRAGRL